MPEPPQGGKEIHIFIAFTPGGVTVGMFAKHAKNVHDA
jgi:hypothetical protein